jgi:hypothetical protein
MGKSVLSSFLRLNFYVFVIVVVVVVFFFIVANLTVACGPVCDSEPDDSWDFFTEPDPSNGCKSPYPRQISELMS